MKLAVPVTELFQLYLKENPSEKSRMEKLRLADRELAEEAAEQARQENNLEIVVVRAEDLRTRTGDSPSAYVGYKLLGYQSVAVSKSKKRRCSAKCSCNYHCVTIY